VPQASNVEELHECVGCCADEDESEEVVAPQSSSVAKRYKVAPVPKKRALVPKGRKSVPASAMVAPGPKKSALAPKGRKSLPTSETVASDATEPESPDVSRALESNDGINALTATAKKCVHGVTAPVPKKVRSSG